MVEPGIISVKWVAIYEPLVGWTGLGWFLGRSLPKLWAQAVPSYLGKFLFWVGVPIGIVAFLRHTQLSSTLWLAPVCAWMAILLGLGMSWGWGRWQRSPSSTTTRTSFLLTSMVGNTGYIGFPISLTLLGPQYFAWAVFYDLLGSTPGAYGLGVVLAAQSGQPQGLSQAQSWWHPLRAMAINPALWSFGLGLVGRDFPLPPWLETMLRTCAWGMVSLSLVLVGMRLSQISSLNRLGSVMVSLSIKMVVIPLILGSGLWLLGLKGSIHQALLLQMAMPPAFATLVISEAYELDPEFAVTAIAIGCFSLLMTLPLWLWLFPNS